MLAPAEAHGLIRRWRAGTSINRQPFEPKAIVTHQRDPGQLSRHPLELHPSPPGNGHQNLPPPLIAQHPLSLAQRCQPPGLRQIIPGRLDLKILSRDVRGNHNQRLARRDQRAGESRETAPVSLEIGSVNHPQQEHPSQQEQQQGSRIAQGSVNLGQTRPNQQKEGRCAGHGVTWRAEDRVHQLRIDKQ